VLGVVALRPLPVLLELLLGQIPRLGIDEGRHRDRYPLLLGPLGVAAEVSGTQVLEARAAHRPLRIDPLGAVVVAHALVDGVPQDVSDRALTPSERAALAGGDAPLPQEPLHGVAAHAVFDAPPEDLPDHLGLGLVDHQFLRGALGLADEAVAVGGVAPVDLSLPGGEQPPAPGPLLDEGALVLGEDALDLQEHPLLRGLAEGVVEEHHLAAGPLQLLHHEDPVGVVPREPVRGRDEHRLEGSFGGQVAQTIQPGTVQVRAAAPLVDEDVGGRHLVAAFPGGPVKGVELAADRLLLLLALGGDPGVDRGDLQRPVEASGFVPASDLAGGVRTVVLRSRSSSSMALHTRLFASRHGTLTPSMRSRGSPSPPVPNPMHPPPSRALARMGKCRPIRRAGGPAWRSRGACDGRARWRG